MEPRDLERESGLDVNLECGEWIHDLNGKDLIEGTEFDIAELQKSASITPLKNEVLVRRRKMRPVTRGGIHLPDQETRSGNAIYANRGAVVMIGPDVQNLLPGDEVLTRANYGREVLGNDSNVYWLISDNDIQAIVGIVKRKLLSATQLRIEEQRAYE